MTSKKKLQEDFFTCVICHEILKEPVSLHCAHHFCAGCLTSYISTKPEAIKQTSIPCPTCRDLTKIPDPTRPVHDWVTQLKTGFFVQGLMEAILSTDEMEIQDSHDCSTCKLEGRKTPASFSCIQCQAFTCVSCQKSHDTTHSLVDIITGSPKKTNRKCGEHQDKELELYCWECNKIICSLCCLNHRKCERVITMEEAGAEIQPKLKEKSSEINSRLQIMREEAGKKSQDISKLDGVFSNLEMEVDQASQAIIDSILSKAEALKKEAHLMKERKVQNLIALKKSLEIEIENLEKEQKTVDHAEKSFHDVEKIDAYKNLQPAIVPKTDDTSLEIKFESFEQKWKAAIEEMELGRFYFLKNNFKKVDTRKSNLKLQHELDIEIPEDNETPFLRDVLATNLSGLDVIIVADSENKCIKSFYEKTKHSYLPLPSVPCKMTKISQTQGAITLSNKSILVFEINPALKNKTTIRTQKKYYGIAWLRDGTFAVGGLSPVCVDIVDMSGRILKSLAHFVQDDLVFWNFQTPVFLCAVPSGGIVVSDYTTRQVTVLSKGLDIEHRFPRLLPQEERTLKNPLGVACGTNDDIFVVDRSREVVIQLDKDAQFIRNVLTPRNGLEGATCIFVDEEDRLFLAVNNRRVKTFTFE